MRLQLEGGSTWRWHGAVCEHPCECVRSLARSAFYLRASIDAALAAGNNAKSPDTSHPQNWSLGGRNFRPGSSTPVLRHHRVRIYVWYMDTCVCGRAYVPLQGERRSELEWSSGAARAARRGYHEIRPVDFTPHAADKGCGADFRSVDLRYRDFRRALPF